MPWNASAVLPTPEWPSKLSDIERRQVAAEAGKIQWLLDQIMWPDLLTEKIAPLFGNESLVTLSSTELSELTYPLSQIGGVKSGAVNLWNVKEVLSRMDPSKIPSWKVIIHCADWVDRECKLKDLPVL
jgi:hypothetical protein